MIPILYPPDEQSFTNNGLGRLADCRRFEVTEERNGIYECEFEYPTNGPLFNKIKYGYFVFATHDDSKTPQAFEIYSREATLDGWALFRAWHVSYQLNDIIVRPYTASGIAQAIARISANEITPGKFTFWTDKTTAGDFELSVPKAARALLGGSEGSLLDVFGSGDYEFDMYSVKLYADRGTDRGVSIRYGKNLASLDQKLEGGNILNGVVPYWQSTDGEVVYLTAPIYAGGAIAYLTPLQTHTLEVIQTHVPEDIYLQFVNAKMQALDLSAEFETTPTPVQLAAKAQEIISGSATYQLEENLAIDFVALWQTEEYKNVANLQRVYLCDTVNVFYERLGISVAAKVIKVVYDTLRERYTSMELGKPKTTLAQQIQQTVSSGVLSEVKKTFPDKSAMQNAIDHATKMIEGGLGGYVVIEPDGSGYPQEILIMDTPDKGTAVNVWRFNQGGLGHSHTGYSGPFNDIALTADGKINATMMTTGTLNANVIAANSIAVSKLTGSITNGDWKIDLDAGTMTLGKLAVGSITGNITNGDWKIDFTNGTLTIGNITANKITSGTLNVGNLTVTGTIQDNLSTPKNYWNLNTGEFVTTQGKLGDFTIGEGLTATGTLAEISLVPSGLTTKTLTTSPNRNASLNMGQLSLAVEDQYHNWNQALTAYATGAADGSNPYGVITGPPTSGVQIKLGPTYNDGVAITGPLTVNSHAVLEIH